MKKREDRDWIRVNKLYRLRPTHPAVEWRPNPYPEGSYLAAQFEVAMAGRNLARQVAWSLGLYRLVDWLASKLPG